MDFLDVNTANLSEMAHSGLASSSEHLYRSDVRSNAIQNNRSEQVISSENLILRSLPDDVFELIRPYLRRTYVRREQFLFQQDDEMETIFFPETAALSELHILDDGRMVEISLTGREGAIGIASLYQSGCRIANCVQVSQPGSVIKIESSALKKLSSIHPRLLPLLQTGLENYIRQISQKAVCNMYHSVMERFCTWLLMIQNRCRNASLKLTHEQIARILGVYRPSVTCIALDMKKKKLIEYSRGKIFIRDREQMRNLACKCYSELDDVIFQPQLPELSRLH